MLHSGERTSVFKTFDPCLTEIESGACPEQLESLMGGPVNIKPKELTIPLQVLSGEEEEEMGTAIKRTRYEDLD